MDSETAIVTAFVALLGAVVFVLWFLPYAKRRNMKWLPASKIVLLCGGLAFLLAGLFPPWTLILDQGPSNYSEKSVRYSSVFSPPAIRPLREKFYSGFSSSDASYRVKIDATRLLIEWACVVVGGAVSWVLFVLSKPTHEQRKDNR